MQKALIKFFSNQLLFILIVISVLQVKAQIKSASFGTQFEHELEIKNKDHYVKSISIQELDNNYYKDYYFTLKTNDANWKNDRIVLINSINDTKYKLVIPPLKPNAFYRIKYEYFEDDNLYVVMKMLHDEGIVDWEKEDKKWMMAFRVVSDKYDDYMLTYRTTKDDIVRYYNLIKDKSLTNSTQKTEVINITNDFFKKLKLNNATFDDIKIIEYASYIQSVDINSITDDNLNIFEQTIGSYYDYSTFYSLYEKHFKNYFNNNAFITTDYIEFFNKKIEEEVKLYKNEALPNTLKKIEEQIKSGYQALSTFATSFQTAFQRTIVPDFGYVVYINRENSFTGGSPFIGVNLSLSPVNKDIPMQISTLSIWQRLSIHTGIVINSLAESKKRENLFKDNSAMLGIGYKIFNHNFRINVGGVFYKSIDPINGSKSFAVQPYIGLSIDFEIRKWLSQLVPGLKL